MELICLIAAVGSSEQMPTKVVSSLVEFKNFNYRFSLMAGG